MGTDLANQVKQLQTVLRQFDGVLNAIAEAVVWTDARQRVKRCNPAFMRLVNCSMDAVLGAWLPDLLPLTQKGYPVPPHAYPDQRYYRETLRAASPEAFNQSSDAIATYEFRHDQGIHILEILSTDAVEDDSACVLIIRDVSPLPAVAECQQAETDLQVREAALENSLSLLQATFESIQDGILAVDHRGNMVGHNQKFLEMWSISPETLIEPQQYKRIAYLANQLTDPEGFIQRVRDLYATPETDSYDVLELTDGRVFERYSCPQRLGDAIVGRVWSFRDITEQKRAEAALRASEEKFRRIVENANDVIYVIQPDGHFLYLTPNLLNITGFQPEELEGKPFMPLVYPDDLPHCLEALHQVLQTGQRQFDIEYRVLHKDGSWNWYSANLALSQGMEGQPVVVGVSRNIHDRKHAEEALRRIVEGTAAKTGEEFFRAFVRSLAEVLQVRYVLVTEFVNEGQSRVRTLAVWSNGAVGDNFEYDPRGGPCETVLQGDMGYYPERLQAIFADDPDLVTLGAESYLGMPLMDASRQVLGHLAVMDTKPMKQELGRELILQIFAARAGAELERKQADEALQHRAQVDSLLSRLSRQFIDQDANTAIQFTLEAIATFIGAERSCIFEYLSDQQRYRLTAEWCAPQVRSLSGIAKGGSASQLPWLHQRISSGRGMQVSCLAELPPEALPERRMFEQESIQSVMTVPMIHSGSVVGFIGADTVHAMKCWTTEEANLLQRVGELIAIGLARYRAEAALRDAKEAAEAANRAKSTFLANMSHELRTPLNSILGFAQLMERDPTLAPHQQEFLATINRSGEHLLNLINDVLEMSKIEAGRITLNPTTFDLHRLLQTLEAMFRIRADAKGLCLEFAIAPDVPQFISTDEGKLRQVLINLLSNAIKFTQRGSVTLRVAVGSERVMESDGVMEWGSKGVDEPPSPRYPITRSPDHPISLLFEVEDTGRGIAPEEIEKLFQPFVQTASGIQAEEGTGLGLALSRQFVQLMGGEIQLRSTVGQGSVFHFTIQVNLASPPEELDQCAVQRRVIGLAPNQPIYRILVVDDRTENREVIRQLLTTVGFAIRTAADGQDAIAQWQNWHPHLIWMDMRMPVMDGYEATRQIRAQEEKRGREDGGDREVTSLLSSPSPLRTKIIALTASAFKEQRAQILAAGCDDLVRKPFREQVIFDKIARHLDVQYVYEESEVLPTAHLAQKPTERLSLSSEYLLTLPREWIAALEQAAIEVDADQIMQLIEQIPTDQADIAIALTDLVNRYCFDEILELVQGSPASE